LLEFLAVYPGQFGDDLLLLLLDELFHSQAHGGGLGDFGGLFQGSV
jgi:hypothetical protein